MCSVGNWVQTPLPNWTSPFLWMQRYQVVQIVAENILNTLVPKKKKKEKHNHITVNLRVQ